MNDLIPIYILLTGIIASMTMLIYLNSDYMSFNKVLAIIVFWPFVLIVSAIKGVFELMGLE